MNIRPSNGHTKPFSPTYDISIPEPILLKTDTPERIESVIRLIKNATVPNQVQVLATPEFVRALIQMQTEFQRKLNQRTVDQLATDHRNGHFEYTGDTIKFAVGGKGIDGQHRCEAQAQAEATTKILLVFGLPLSVIEKVDLNRRRSTGDIHNTRGDAVRITPTAIMTSAIGIEAQDFDLSKVRYLSTTARVAADDKLSNQEMIFVGAMSQALQKGSVRTSGALAGALRAYRMFPEDGDIIWKFLAVTFANQPADPDFVPELSGELYNYLNKSKKAQGGSQAAVYNQAVAVLKTVRALRSNSPVRLTMRSATNAEIQALSQ